MTNSDRELLRRLVFDEGKLHDLLYGRWVQWGGKRPPAHVGQNLLRDLPTGVLQALPSEIFLDVSTISPLRIGVFAGVDIEEKTVLGPIEGRRTKSLENGDTESAWEVLDDKGRVTGHIQSLDADSGSWMGLVQCARYADEQNLEMFQDDSQVYYRVIKNIQVGEELLVWYSVQVPQCLGIPYFEHDRHKNVNSNNEREQLLPSPAAVTEEERKKVNCVLCHKGFNSRSNLRSHMRIHTNQRPFKCTTCGRSFSQSSTLRNHSRLHTGEKPYKCSICKCAYSQLAGLRAHQKSSQHRPKHHPSKYYWNESKPPQQVDFPDLVFARYPVPHSKAPIPTCQLLRELCADKCCPPYHSYDANEGGSEYEEMSSIPQHFKQDEFNNLTCDLNLSKAASKLLASRLKDKSL